MDERDKRGLIEINTDYDAHPEHGSYEREIKASIKIIDIYYCGTTGTTAQIVMI